MCKQWAFAIGHVPRTLWAPSFDRERIAGRFGRTPREACLDTGAPMTLIILLLVLLLLFGGGGFYMGGPAYGGGGLALVILVLVVLYVAGVV